MVNYLAIVSDMIGLAQYYEEGKRDTMDYNYQIHNADININESFNTISIFFVLTGSVTLYDKAYLGSYHKHEFFLIQPYSAPKLLINSGKVIALNINKLSFNRFSLFNWDNLELDQSKIDNFIKKELLDTIISIYEKDYFNADISIIRLINFIRLGNYYREHNLEASNPLINNVLIYINEHYKENLTLATIAEKFYVNSSYLSRVFSETMNISLIKYIRKLKIYRLAVEILSSNNHKDIWKSYGYKSYSTYLKNFQRVFSISPEAFIDNHKGTTAKNIGFPSELYSYLKNLAKHFSNN